MDMVVELKEKLTLRQPLIGCFRRNQWDPRKPKYSMVKGNAVLFTLGTARVTLDTPVGPSDHMILDNHVVLFRAGPWRSYWVDDARDEITLLRAFDYRISEVALVAHENSGDLVIKEVDCGDHPLLYKADIEELVSAYRAEARIPKNCERAFRICRTCPVKNKCDAYDRQIGEINDWHPNYPFP